MTNPRTDAAVEIPVRIDIDEVIPDFMKRVAVLDSAAVRELEHAGIAPGLRELVRLRASQINGCAYCVSEHTKDAVAAGEPAGRIAAIGVWRESSFFTARERAALALTESMTRVADTHVPDTDWQEAAAVLTQAELGALIALITVINAWNVIGVTTRAWHPEL